ncbi:Regulatory protein suaprga1, partial [Rhizoctonia solani]
MRAFGTTAWRLSQGETDLSLSQKLHEEINFELQAAKANAEVPAFLKEFQSSGIWKIEDLEGHDEVALERTFGNETIRVLFSIADIDAPQDPAFEDAEGADEQDAPIPMPPIRCSIIITKGSDQGALSIDALAQDGAIVVDNISFYTNAKLATELTSEADWKRRGLYIGPQFDHLDTNVQEEFERYLDERGIGGDLALFVPDYAEYKEQKFGYVRGASSQSDRRLRSRSDVAKFPYSGPVGHVTLSHRPKHNGPRCFTTLVIMSSVSIPISGASATVTSNLSTPASSPGSPFGLLIYTREELLSLASSPLSQTPPDSAAFSDFPTSILRTRGNGLSNTASNDAKDDSDKEEAAPGLSTSQQFELELE